MENEEVKLQENNMDFKKSAINCLTEYLRDVDTDSELFSFLNRWLIGKQQFYAGCIDVKEADNNIANGIFYAPKVFPVAKDNAKIPGVTINSVFYADHYMLIDFYIKMSCDLVFSAPVAEVHANQLCLVLEMRQPQKETFLKQMVKYGDTFLSDAVPIQKGSYRAYFLVS